jgi:hypothetical protein
MKWLVFLLFLAGLSAQLLVKDLADITGDGAVHPLSATAIRALYIIIQCPSTNSAVVRIGSANIGSARGLQCGLGGVVNLYPAVNGLPQYDLSKVYYLAGSGDKISVLYGQ